MSFSHGTGCQFCIQLLKGPFDSIHNNNSTLNTADARLDSIGDFFYRAQNNFGRLTLQLITCIKWNHLESLLQCQEQG